MLFIGIIFVLLVSPSEQVADLCRSLHTPQISNVDTICTGMVSNSFLLVTNNMFVYELPVGNLNESTRSREMKLVMNLTALPLKEKWPKLAENQHFNEMIKRTSSSFTYISNNDEPHLVMTEMEKYGNGIDFNIKTGKIEGTINDTSVIFVSTTDKTTIYGFLRNSINQIFMRDYKLITNDGKLDLVPNDDWYFVCDNGDGTIELKANSSLNESHRFNSITYGFDNGFLYKGYFYLIGSGMVYSFKDTIYTNRSNFETDIVRMVDVREFYVCPPLSDKGVIALVIILLLVLIALGSVCYMMFCSKGNNSRSMDADQPSKDLNAKSNVKPVESNKLGKVPSTKIEGQQLSAPPKSDVKAKSNA